MEFSSFQIQDSQFKEEVKKTQKKRVNFNELVDIPFDEKPLGKMIRDREPGIKIGTGSFLSVAQYCNHCGAVRPHAHKPKERKMRCLICKEDYKY